MYFASLACGEEQAIRKQARYKHPKMAADFRIKEKTFENMIGLVNQKEGSGRMLKGQPL
jgi:hypothetical protein